MSSLPPTHLQQIDQAIQAGRGAAASVLGQTYTQYRLGSTSGSITSGAPVATNFPARIGKAQKKAVENQSFDLLIFEAICDNRTLDIGDLLVETGYGSDGGQFWVAQKRPTRETLWVRAESNCNVTRPMPTAGAASEQPASGPELVDGYAGLQKDTEQILTLQNGLYSFTSAQGATKAVIPAGLQPLNRIKDARDPGIPTALYREHFLIYLPLLPGAILNELDRISFSNMGDAYEIALMFTTEQTGLSGWILVAEKLARS